MNPIISPVLIYLIGISSNIQWLCHLLAGVAISFAVVAAAIYLVNRIEAGGDDDAQHTLRLCLKVIKYSLIYAVILGVIASLIPNKEVAIAMVVANYITPDNLQGTNDVIKSNLQDYVNIIVEAINRVEIK